MHRGTTPKNSFAQCTRKISSAVKWWRPGWSIFLRLLVLPRDTPRWPSSTSLRHVFGPGIIIRMPMPYVPFTKAAAACGGRFGPGQSVWAPHAQHMHITPPATVNCNCRCPSTKACSVFGPAVCCLGAAPITTQKALLPAAAHAADRALSYSMASVRHALTCMPFIPLLLMTRPEKNLVGLHTDLQMLFHLYPLPL